MLQWSPIISCWLMFVWCIFQLLHSQGTKHIVIMIQHCEVLTTCLCVQIILPQIASGAAEHSSRNGRGCWASGLAGSEMIRWSQIITRKGCERPTNEPRSPFSIFKITHISITLRMISDFWWTPSKGLLSSWQVPCCHRQELGALQSNNARQAQDSALGCNCQLSDTL